MDSEKLKESFDSYFQLILKEIFDDFDLRVESNLKQQDIFIEIFDDEVFIGRISLDNFFCGELFYGIDLDLMDYEDNSITKEEFEERKEDFEYNESLLQNYKETALLLHKIANKFEEEINKYLASLEDVKLKFSKNVKTVNRTKLK